MDVNVDMDTEAERPEAEEISDSTVASVNPDDNEKPRAIPKNSRKNTLIILFVIFALSAAVFSANFIFRNKGINFDTLGGMEKTGASDETSGAGANGVGRNGPAPMSDYDFIMLCGKGSSQRIAYVIERGADVNAKGNNDITPLMFAVINNPNREVINTLVNAGADVNAKDGDGMTPLMFAARFSSDNAILETLIEAGADVNAKDAAGMTPFMMAAAYNLNHEVLMTLIKNEASGTQLGINAKAMDKFGNMAVDYARRRASIRYSDVFWKINDISY